MKQAYDYFEGIFRTNSFMSLPNVIWSFFEEQPFRVAFSSIIGLFNAYISVELMMDLPNADKIRKKKHDPSYVRHPSFGRALAFLSALASLEGKG
jgi:hypothetical protein